MMGLTPRAVDLLAIIADSVKKRGFAPTYDEMLDALGAKSKNSVSRLLDQLVGRGYVVRLSKKARAIELVSHSGTVCCPNCNHEFDPATHTRGVSLGDDASGMSRVAEGSRSRKAA